MQFNDPDWEWDVFDLTELQARVRALTQAQEHTRTRTHIDPLAHQCMAIFVRTGIFSKIRTFDNRSVSSGLRPV